MDGQKGGAVAAFAMDRKTGKLTFLNRVSSKGSGPCYVSVDRSGKAVMVANYNSGSVALMPLKEDGSLQEASTFLQHAGSGAIPQRQKGPHAHSINPSPDNRFAVATDLGLDEVLVYKLDPVKGTLAPNDPPFTKVDPGAGPRHFDFSPDGRHAYVINEMGNSVTAFSWDAKRGALAVLETVSTLPKDFHGQSDCAQVRVHPNGRFLYGSNRGHDSIAVFAIDRAKGTLTPVEHVLERRQGAAQLRNRSRRALPVRGESEFRERGGVPHRREDRQTHPGGPEPGSGLPGVREVRGGGVGAPAYSRIILFSFFTRPVSSSVASTIWLVS